MGVNIGGLDTRRGSKISPPETGGFPTSITPTSTGFSPGMLQESRQFWFCDKGGGE